MAEKTLREIFAKKLNYYLASSGKNQSDLCKYMGVSSATASDWCNANKMPRADKIEKIAHWLGVSIGDLMEDKPELTQRDTKQIEKILNETKEKLTSQEGLMFEGDPASPEAIESILNAMEIGMAMAKKKNKEKYTPKKYKKDRFNDGH
ncbi:MAG TPA: helix-turn-helix domain-containing protein [Candidatus Anaerostipes excrementavium]|uniref:Helix-turn-helix domain-containing protein n=1 Tax=Candidatus Anaerostipes excrementavium TaxID=2838463 RepID=A0A9D1WUG9_9FIRM|nr:helix-turn-helix transcriptional regulator [uncultured Anaerostipes sp.]HIX67353.1 helix-turn-helix domain-containing protein [Candidatus Anaerostipes excrementavium]